MSLRKAINDKCRECIYDERGGGTWRQQVEACTAFKCPLYPVRPVSATQKDEAESESTEKTEAK